MAGLVLISTQSYFLDAGYSETGNVKEVFQVRQGRNMPWPNLEIEGENFSDIVSKFFASMGTLLLERDYVTSYSISDNIARTSLYSILKEWKRRNDNKATDEAIQKVVCSIDPQQLVSNNSEYLDLFLLLSYKSFTISIYVSSSTLLFANYYNAAQLPCPTHSDNRYT